MVKFSPEQSVRGARFVDNRRKRRPKNQKRKALGWDQDNEAVDTIVKSRKRRAKRKRKSRNKKQVKGGIGNLASRTKNHLKS